MLCHGFRQVAVPYKRSMTWNCRISRRARIARSCDSKSRLGSRICARPRYNVLCPRRFQTDEAPQPGENRTKTEVAEMKTGSSWFSKISALGGESDATGKRLATLRRKEELETSRDQHRRGKALVQLGLGAVPPRCFGPMEYHTKQLLNSIGRRCPAPDLGCSPLGASALQHLLTDPGPDSLLFAVL